MPRCVRLVKGRVWHYVHATCTALLEHPGHIEAMCSAKGRVAEEAGDKPVAHCKTCVEYDNLHALTRVQRLVNILCWSVRHNVVHYASRREAGTLRRHDLINAQGRFTARGQSLLLDFIEGPVPLPDEHGVYHARRPLRLISRCSLHLPNPTLPPEAALKSKPPLSIDAYVALRATPHPVTCLTCMTK